MLLGYISLARNPGHASSYVFHARGRMTRVSHERYVPKADATICKIINFEIEKVKMFELILFDK